MLSDGDASRTSCGTSTRTAAACASGCVRWRTRCATASLGSVACGLHHRDGHRLPVKIATQPIRDAAGTIIGAVESFADDSSLQSMRARLAEMEHLAMVDPLTDIPNRRYLEMTLSSRLAELERYERRFAVAMVDLDDFKVVNDTLGHEVSDAALTMVATVLAANARLEDVVARLSGDEFVVVLQHAPLPEAVQVCELRTLVSSSRLDRNDTIVQVTASFGVTAAQHGDDVRSLLRRADDHPYRAKATRNSLVAG
jgi:diguanylate cyclase (GGDEF)-like protein